MKKINPITVILGTIILIFIMWWLWNKRVRYPFLFEIECEQDNSTRILFFKQNGKYYQQSKFDEFANEISEDEFKKSYRWYKFDERGDGLCGVINEKQPTKKKI